jgi:RNA polymerase sigma factor (sigma-70 family)
MHDLTTRFVGRLRARDPQAWFELWETFGPILRAQLARWGRGRIGPETVADLSQETLTALSTAIDRHDPSKGARFSTWLLAIAKYTLSDEMDKRYAQKRGGGIKPLSLSPQDDDGPGFDVEGGERPDQEYEAQVFEAKVDAALRQVERSVGFEDFEAFRQRVLEGKGGRSVAAALGTSEATISRRAGRVRDALRGALSDVFSKYSFTEEDWDELPRNGLELNPKKGQDASFDEALAEVWLRASRRRQQKGRS